MNFKSKQDRKRLPFKEILIMLALITLGIIGYFVYKYDGNDKDQPSAQPVKKVVNAQIDKLAEEYHVRGIDVSGHQGDIDWQQVANEDIHFAYIKATEGTTFVDKKFADNWAQASETDLKIGAYHFLSYESPGTTQADNFIKTVPRTEGMMPPMIDIEFEILTVLPDTEVVVEHIRDLITKIEEHYDQVPILYVNIDSYKRFIIDNFEDYPIWFCDINRPPNIPDGREWTIWQHSHTGQIRGIKDGAANVDLNVYKGSYDEFINNYLK